VKDSYIYSLFNKPVNNMPHYHGIPVESGNFSTTDAGVTGGLN